MKHLKSFHFLALFLAVALAFTALVALDPETLQAQGADIPPSGRRSSGEDPEGASGAPYAQLFETVWSTINEAYAGVPPVSWAAMREMYWERVAWAQSVEDAYAALSEMVDRLGDPYTFVTSPAEVAALGSGSTSGGYDGVGMYLGTTTTGEVFVAGVMSGGPAFRAGVRAGERITSVDGESASGLASADLASLIRGERGTTVRLGLAPPSGAERVLSITRAPVELPKDATSRVLNGGIGYIALPSLREGIDVEFLSHLRRHYRTRALIVDLRNQDGQVAPVVVTRIAGLLTKEPLAALFTRIGAFAIHPDAVWEGGTGNILVPPPTSFDYYGKPVAFIVDELAAYNIFELALLIGMQEAGRAILVGRAPEIGSGTGVGYASIELPEGGILNYTASYLVSLKERTFVTTFRPDVAVPLDASYLRTLYSGEDPDVEAAREALLERL